MWAFYKLKLSSRTRKYRTCGYLKKNFKLQKILISCFFRPLFQKNKKNKKKKPQSIPEPQRGNCWYKTLLTPGLERIRHEDVKSTSMYKCVFLSELWSQKPSHTVFSPFKDIVETKKITTLSVWVQRWIFAPYQHCHTEWCKQRIIKPLLGTHLGFSQH